MNALLAALAACGLQAPPVFRADVEVVRVEVLVTRAGVPVRGLSAADFELREDGVPQPLAPVLEEETPVDAALVLDLSASVSGAKLEALKAAGRAFLDGLRDGERAALVVFDHEVRLAEPLTGDIPAVRRALEAASPRGTTALVDAAYAALRLWGNSQRRTVLLVFSDGLDNLSWLTPSEVLETARRSNATAYAVTVRASGEPRERFLADLVRATGGRLFEAQSESHLHRRFLDVLADIRARYVLSYMPGATSRAGWHRLEVRLKRGEADVLARPGYWRPGPGSP